MRRNVVLLFGREDVGEFLSLAESLADHEVQAKHGYWGILKIYGILLRENKYKYFETSVESLHKRFVVITEQYLGERWVLSEPLPDKNHLHFLGGSDWLWDRRKEEEEQNGG